MKYLIKRNDFLRGAKRLDEKSEFLRDAKISGNRLYQDLIKEAGNSGPMENDIGWNDSLVGRFINHLIRKAKVANNLRKIKGVIKSLEGEFVRIEAEGFAYKLDDEQKKLYQKTILYSFFFELKEAVKNGSEVTIIINITNNAIANIKGIKDDMLDDRTKELLTKELELFLNFLEKFKEEETEEEEEEEETEEEDGTEAGAGAPVSVNMRTMINNLNALHNILKVYKSVNIAKKDPELKVKNTYTTKDGETIESIQKNLNINKNNLASSEIIAKNVNEPKLKAAFDKKPNIAKEKVALPGNISLVLESLYTVNESSNPKERYLSEAFAKLIKDIDVLVAKDAKLPITQEFIRILLAKHKNPKNDKLIVALYDNINKYLVGDKKQTIQEKDPLYKESYEYLMPKNEKNPNGGKIEVVAEKMARFSKRALQFDGKGLYDGLKELGVPLKNYVDTLKVLMKNPITNVKPEYSEQSEEKKKDGKLNVGQKYIQTKENGEKKVVTLVSKTHVMTMGDDKKWATKDDAEGGKLTNSQEVSVVDDNSTTSYGVLRSTLSPYVDQKGRETKYKKDELIKDIERATKKALELEKDNPEKAAKIQASIDKKKAELDKLDESVNESVYISKLMEIQVGMRAIMLELNEALKNNSKPVGRLLKFDRFMSYIKEADEVEPDGEAGDPRSGMTTVEKIQDFFDKKCMTVKEFTMEKTEFDKVRTNFENIEKDKDTFVIDGYDPIIEILKLFNRAYKLYMTQFISKRTNFDPEGGIGVSTAAEYTSFGGSDNKGPYRNNKIFDAWESAVLDIMKDRKYQFIFDKKTKLRVGNEIRPNKGALLRQFMTDMLNGENLYKSGGYDSSGKKGAQSELLDKYFGPPDGDTALTPENTGFDNDVPTNTLIQNDVNNNAIKVKATVFTNATTPEGNKPANVVVKNAFLAIKGKDSDDKEVKRFFFISEIDSRMAWMQCSKEFGYFEEYISKIKYNASVQYSTGDLDVRWKTKTNDAPHYTKVKVDEFEKLLLKRGEKIKIGMFNRAKQSIEEETITISDAYWITKEKDGEQIVFDAIQPGTEKDEEKRKQLKKAIEDKNGASSVKYLIENRDKAVIKKDS